MKVGIVNYDMGNIRSVANAIHAVGGETMIIDRPEDFAQADKLILPGVGAFPEAMERIREKGFAEILTHIFGSSEKTVLGLCLGMQLLFDESAEFTQTRGLGWIHGTVQQIPKTGDSIRIPHMGWNELEIVHSNPLTQGIDAQSSDVYFVHSYYCKCEDPGNVVARVNYGTEMDVMVQKGNVFGCQFHPEKSQQNGLLILKNFLEYRAC